MLRNLGLIAMALIFTTSCTTTAARNLKDVTRVNADASFAFDDAVRNFSATVTEFRRAITSFEFAVRNFETTKISFDTDDAFRSFDLARHAHIDAATAMNEASFAQDIASQAHETSQRSGLEFRRAQQELLLSPDPWENNRRIRSSAISANNESVRIHNSALVRFESTMSFFLDALETFNEWQNVFRYNMVLLSERIYDLRYVYD